MYAILQKPEPGILNESDLDEIWATVGKIAARGSGSIRTPRPESRDKEWRKKVQNVWRHLYELNIRRQISVMRELGLEVIWCRHADIPKIANRIVL